MYSVYARCCPSFSFFHLLLHFFNSLTWLTFSFNCLYLFHPLHIWHSFFSFPNTSSKLDRLFHLWHLFFMCLLFFQRSEESFLASLEHGIVFLVFFLDTLPTLFFCTSACPTTAPLHFPGRN